MGIAGHGLIGGWGSHPTLKTLETVDPKWPLVWMERRCPGFVAKKRKKDHFIIIPSATLNSPRAYAWFVSLSLFSLHPHCSKSAPLPSSWLQTSRLCMAASSPNGSLVKAWGFGRTMRSSLEQGDARDLRAACVQISDAAIELIAISNANRRF